MNGQLFKSAELATKQRMPQCCVEKLHPQLLKRWWRVRIDVGVRTQPQCWYFHTRACFCIFFNTLGLSDGAFTTNRQRTRSSHTYTHTGSFHHNHNYPHRQYQHQASKNHQDVHTIHLFITKNSLVTINNGYNNFISQITQRLAQNTMWSFLRTTSSTIRSKEFPHQVFGQRDSQPRTR